MDLIMNPPDGRTDTFSIDDAQSTNNITSTDEQASILRLFAQLECDCKVKRRAYALSLSRVLPLKWLLVGGSAVLSLVAGTTILSKPDLFGEKQWSIYAGICALLSSMLVTLHTALKCEPYQAECARLVVVYSQLATSFRIAQSIPRFQLAAKLKELAAKLDDASKAIVLPFEGCLRRAEAEHSVGTSSSDA